MKLLEYEAKSILAASEIAIPRSFIVEPGSKPAFLPAVIKSQVPIGGRGKAGGVVVAKTEREYSAAARRIATLEISGFTPRKLLAEELVDIDRELYLSLLIDISLPGIILMAHRDGGMDVEDNQTDDYLKLELGDMSFEVIGEQLGEYFDLPEKSALLGELVHKLYGTFTSNDAALLEINPLIYTQAGTFVAGDCKMECDDAAAFRHPDWQFESGAVEANFVTLDPKGDVATIANGAGLAMATVDAVAGAGLRPANFLDIGGGANEASVLAAFRRIVEFPGVKTIVINIFAGITRCDEVARAIITASRAMPNLPPLCIRLAGTNVEPAAELLEAEHIQLLGSLEDCIASAKGHVS